MNISESIMYAGVNDHDIDLFEGQFKVPLGMAYNSYVILENKVTMKIAMNDGVVPQIEALADALLK